MPGSRELERSGEPVRLRNLASAVSAAPAPRSPQCAPGGVLLLCGLILGGCGQADDDPRHDATQSPPEPLRVAAASDLQAVLPILAERFRRDAGIEVVSSIGSSGNLARQIRQGAPFDLFLSANSRYVEELAAEGIIEPATVAPYAVGVLVLVVDGRARGAISVLADLEKPDVKKVAIANPDFAPYGMAARQALERAGLWQAVAPRLVMAESVRHALQYVQTGNAEAGLVALSNALGAPELDRLPVDPSLHAPIVQTLGVVADSPRAADARNFARFLLAETGQEILVNNGFRPIPEREPSATVE